MREDVRVEAEECAVKCRALIEGGATVTLNGKPAWLYGFSLDFAKVQDQATGLSAEWSWHSAYINMTRNGGRFES